MLHNKTNTKQGRLIPILNRFIKLNNAKNPIAFEVNKTGVCSGLASRYLLKKFKGEEKSFFAELEKISNLKKEDYQSEEPFLTNFITKTQVAYHPAEYLKKTEQGDIDRFQGEFAGAFTRDGGGFANVKLDVLADFLETIMNRDESYHYIAADKHAIAVCKKGEKFYFYDSNQEEAFDKEFSTIEELSFAIEDALRHSKTHIDIRIKSFIPSNTQPKINEDNLYDEIQKYHEIAIAPADKPQDMQDLKIKNAELLLRAVKNNSISLVVKLLAAQQAADPTKKIFKITETGKPRSALELACIYGYTDIATTMINTWIKKDKTATFNVLKEALPWVLEKRDPNISKAFLSYFQDEQTFETNTYIRDKDTIAKLFMFTILGKDKQTWKDLNGKYPLDQNFTNAQEQLELMTLALEEGADEFSSFILEKFPNLENQNNIKDWIHIALKAKQEKSLQWALNKVTEKINFSDVEIAEFMTLAIATGNQSLVSQIILKFPNYAITAKDCENALQNGEMAVLNQLVSSAKDKDLRKLSSSLESTTTNNKLNIKWKSLFKKNNLSKLAKEQPRLVFGILHAALNEQNFVLAKQCFDRLKNTYDQEVFQLIQTKLVNAATTYDLELMQELVTHFGADITTAKSDQSNRKKHLHNKSLFEIACILKDTEMLIFLLNHTDQLDENVKTNLFITACKMGAFNVATKLIEKFKLDPTQPVTTKDGSKHSFLTLAITSENRSPALEALLYQKLLNDKPALKTVLDNLTEGEKINLSFSLLGSSSKSVENNIALHTKFIEEQKLDDKISKDVITKHIKQAVVQGNYDLIIPAMIKYADKIVVADLNEYITSANHNLTGKVKENVLGSLANSEKLLNEVKTKLLAQGALKTSKFGRSHSYNASVVTSTARTVFRIINAAEAKCENVNASTTLSDVDKRLQRNIIWDKALHQVYKELNYSVNSYSKSVLPVTLFGTTETSFKTYNSCIETLSIKNKQLVNMHKDFLAAKANSHASFRR